MTTLGPPSWVAIGIGLGLLAVALSVARGRSKRWRRLPFSGRSKILLVVMLVAAACVTLLQAVAPMPQLHALAAIATLVLVAVGVLSGTAAILTSDAFSR